MDCDTTDTGCAALAVTEVSVDGHECCRRRRSDDDYSSIMEYMKLFSLRFVVTLCMTWRSHKGH